MKIKLFLISVLFLVINNDAMATCRWEGKTVKPTNKYNRNDGRKVTWGIKINDNDMECYEAKNFRQQKKLDNRDMVMREELVCGEEKSASHLFEKVKNGVYTNSDLTLIEHSGLVFGTIYTKSEPRRKVRLLPASTDGSWTVNPNTDRYSIRSFEDTKWLNSNQTELEVFTRVYYYRVSEIGNNRIIGIKHIKRKCSYWSEDDF